MFDLEDEHPNFIFAKEHRKAAYLALEYKTLKTITRLTKSVERKSLP